MTRAVVAFGSNIDPERNVAAALERLERASGMSILAVSSLYRTRAVGGEYPDFVNGAVLVETDLTPDDLRSRLHGIEHDLGRVRTEDRNAPRTIDLDVVLYEGFEGSIGDSMVPDPELETRAHLAVPVADVASDWPWGHNGWTVGDLARAVPKEGLVERMSSTTNGGQRYATEGRMEADVGEVYRPEFEALVTSMLEMFGEDPSRPGLARTPLRVAKAMGFLTSGYDITLASVVNDAIFDSDAEEMVVVKDVEFYSLCEHHVLPFFGRAHVAYMPSGRIIGLSKVARIVDLFSRRLQVQERLTNEIADAMQTVLEPHGVAVVMEGSHFCMMMRGVQKQGSSMVTSAMRGGFKDNPSTRAELMGLIAN